MNRNPLSKRNIFFMALLIGVTFTICLSVSSMFAERNQQAMTGSTATSAVVQQMQVID